VMVAPLHPPGCFHAKRYRGASLRYAPRTRLPLIFNASFGGVGVMWLIEELREADGHACRERAAETLHRGGIDAEPCRRLAHAESARTGV
jgi:hypothetical protein